MRRAFAVLLALAAAVLLAAPAAHASPSQFTIFEAPREFSSPEADRHLDEIQALGVGWIRVLVYWKSVAPSPTARTRPAFDETDPGAGYDWTATDRVINAARARGIKVLITPTGPVPKWATRSRSGYTDRPSPTRFERFMTALGRRYGSATNHWTVWNEPNHPQFLTPQYRNGRPASPLHYRKLFFAARRGLAKSGNGGDRVLAGETAPRGTPRVVSPLAFLRGALCLSAGYVKSRRCGRMDVDGWAHHPYTTKAGPFFVPSDADDVTIGVLSRLTRALDRASRAGAIRLSMPVYLTEFGIQSTPDPYVGVSETRQAEFRAIAERIAYRTSRVKAFSQYLMRDDQPRAGSRYTRYSGFESGLRHSDGDAKRAYDGFRLPLAAVRNGGSSRVALWGIARPARTRTFVRIEYRTKSGWKTLKKDATNSRGAWATSTRYRKGRVFRVRWGGFASPPTRIYRR